MCRFNPGDHVVCEWWFRNKKRPRGLDFKLRSGIVTEPRVWIQRHEHVMVLFPEICKEPIPFSPKHVRKGEE